MRLVLAAPLMLAACSFPGRSDADPSGIAGKGSGDARSYAATDFDSIELRGSDDVDVRVGGGFSVRAEGDAGLLDRLRIARDGTTLRIDRRGGSGWHWSGGDAKVIVTMPRIAATRSAGSGNIAIDRVEGARFDGSVAGSGGLTVVAMQVDEARLAVAGSGSAKVGGAARRLEVSITGSGSLAGGDLRVAAATVSVAGSGSVRARLDGPGDVRLTGSGDIDLGSAARCTIHVMGSGKVRCAHAGLDPERSQPG